VKARNAKAEAEIATTADFKSLEAEILAILDSDAKIPGVQKIGDYYYNFWKDKQHERGLWRRTTLAEYRKPQPKWETVLDLDALNKAEGTQMGLARRRLPASRLRALPGRAVARRFRCRRHPRVRPHHQAVREGRLLPCRGQGRPVVDRPRHRLCLHRLRRGQPDQFRLSEHRQGMEARYPAGGGEDRLRRQAGRHVHRRRPRPHARLRARLRQPHLAFYNDELYLRADGSLAKVDAPNSAQKGVHKDWLVLELREPYEAGGKTYKPGR
jgi:prolyl oligopeptidase